MSNNNNSAFAKIDYEKVVSDIRSELGTLLKKPSSPDKKLSESRLGLPALVACPTNVETEITLKEAVTGTNRSFTVKDQIVCNACTNAKPINRLHCGDCKGLGYTLNERQVEIELAAGVSTDEEARYSDLGAYDIRCRRNGDLVVKIKVSEHPYFKIEDKNITCVVSVSLYQAVLGDKINVPTAKGKVTMILNPLTQSGSVYKLKGFGIAGGDQLLTININMPQVLNSEQIQLFEKIKAIADCSNPESNLFNMKQL